MTDQICLLREGSLKIIPRASIQVGGKRLFCESKGIARVVSVNGTRTYLNNVLYVPSLGVNLISAKKLCKKGQKGSFNARSIWICSGRNVVITANQRRALYIVNHISKRHKDLIAQKMN